MKFLELKSRFKNKYAIRVIAGVLCIAVMGTGYGVHTVSAAKVSAEDAVEEAAEEAETAEDSNDAEDDEIQDAIEDVLDDVKADSDVEAGKEETVYLISDADGTVNKTIVSDWLKNADSSAVLEDVSDLEDIENVKGDETFTQSGEKLTWQAEGNDIFYQGTTTKEAPVSEKITYYLDGKEMSPEDIAGKSGKVTIRFDYTNKEKRTVTIDGEEEEIYVPFTVVTGMVLDDSFKNIEVTGGKVISDGKNNVVVGIAMPGLKESLNVDEDDFDTDVEIPDYVEVTADVEDFSLEMTMSIVMNGLQTVNVENIDLTDLDDAMDTLTDAASQLVDGSGTLSDGAKTLSDAVNEYTDGTQTLADGIGTLANSAPALTSGVSTLADGTQSLASGTQSLANGTSDLLTGAQTLASGISTARQGADTLNTSVQTLAAGVPQLISGLSQQAQAYAAQGANVDTDKQAFQDALTAYAVAVQTNGAANADPSGVIAAVEALSNDAGAQGAALALNGVSEQLANGGLTADNINALAAGVNSLDSGLQQLDSGAASLVAGASQVNDGANQVNAGAAQVNAGASQLNSGAGQLKDGVDQLQNGAQTLVSNNADLRDGASALKDGAKELADGIGEFDEEGIQKITDAYNGDVKELLDRLDAVLDAGNSYQIFSQVKDGTTGTVKFIIKTDSVKVDDEN